MMHLAQLNIGRAKYPLDDPRMASFMGALVAINALAERSPGFVWRMQSDSGNATDIKCADDPQQIANLSVWETADALEHFVWNTAHKRIYSQKHAWFETPAQATLVMWPIEARHIPTLADALERLDHLRRQGDSEHAYGWPGLPHLRAWLNQRCG